MKKILIACFALITATIHADQILLDISWAGLARDGKLMGGEVEGDSLRVSNASAEPITKTILVLDAPPITGIQYMLTGKVRHEGVEGSGYLEMWSHFGERGAYFSRTIADSGPMQKLSGSAGWREFQLPFNRGPDTPAPEKLVINVMLPGKGDVYLSPLKLVQPADQARAWWTARQAGLAGGIAGALIGCIGGLVGMLVSTGRARELVMKIVGFMPILGAVVIACGLAALFRKQPYHVYYPLIMIGISILVFLALRTPIRRRYEENELRRMESLDA